MSPAPCTFSAHAVIVLRERDIAPEWVMRVLRAPIRDETDRADSTLRHALGAIAEREGRILRVTYRQSAHSKLIVTAFFDRAETRKQRP